MIYAMSDIHGCYKEFLEMLDKIQFSPTDELYIIGDVIDRGPQPIEMLRYVMAHENMHLIMGNHEKMMLNATPKPDRNFRKGPGRDLNIWYYNGGYITDDQFMDLSVNERKDILSYLKGLPLGLEVIAGQNHYILIHGGPTMNFAEDWDSGKLMDDVLWERIECCSADDIVYPGKIIVVGHTPTFFYGEEQIIKIGDKRLIDCGCVFGHRLGCICLDTEECFYIEPRKENQK